MLKDVVWSYLFAGAIAVLMVAILMTRADAAPTWVFFVYPGIGALLAHVASRTSPTVDGIAWIETSTIAAACVVVLAALVNLLLIDILLREVLSGEFLQGTVFQQFSFFTLPTISALLWWALHRRLSRMRRRAAKTPSDKNDRSDPPAGAAPELRRKVSNQRRDPTDHTNSDAAFSGAGGFAIA